MPGRLYDPEIRGALRALNAMDGVATSASCQGRFSPDERSTHADLGYVIFRHPLPIAAEECLLETIGARARIEPRSVYSAWPEGNREFCRALEAAARAATPGGAPPPRRAVPIADVHAAIERVLARDGPPAPVAWCFRCSALGDALRHGPPCRPVTLATGGAAARLELFDAFLATDPRPPDPRLREREGDAALLRRVERGDFGERYRAEWARYRSLAARRALEEDARDRVRALREGGANADLFFRSGKVVFCGGLD